MTVNVHVQRDEKLQRNTNLSYVDIRDCVACTAYQACTAHLYTSHTKQNETRLQSYMPNTSFPAPAIPCQFHASLPYKNVKTRALLLRRCREHCGVDRIQNTQVFRLVVARATGCFGRTSSFLIGTRVFHLCRCCDMTLTKALQAHRLLFVLVTV